MDEHPLPDGPGRVALLGLGTVGGAVAERLLDAAWREHMAARGLVAPRLVAVAVRDAERARDIPLPEEVRVSTDPAALATADDVEIVVELMGGSDVAAEAVRSALAAGRPVVTANKELLAREGRALETAARESGAALRFEAAVAGGVPVLSTLVRDLAGNRIESIRGIINGTTNHILSTMAADARDYDDVLREAQARGYAESDPSRDVEGRDAAFKLAILVRLAFGSWPDVEAIERSLPAIGRARVPGITGVTRPELSAAARLGLAIKLVARASPGPAGSVRAAVTPMAVGAGSPLGSTAGAANIVEIDGQPVGRIALRGQGAGGPATASAVLADLLRVSSGGGSTWEGLPAGGDVRLEDDLGIERGWFCAVAGVGSEGFPETLREVALATTDEGFVTRPTSLAALSARLDALAGAAVFFPILSDA